LENYVSPEEKAMDQRFIGNEYWTGVSIVTAGFLVNTDVLQKRIFLNLNHGQI
jgi:ABC transporter, periplasmic substrate-binding protein